MFNFNFSELLSRDTLHLLFILEFGYFSKINHSKKLPLPPSGTYSGQMLAETGFQTDTSKVLYDWLTSSETALDWLRA